MSQRRPSAQPQRSAGSTAERVISADPAIGEADKAEALAQVKALAEAGHTPQDGARQKLAKQSMRLLKGMATELPTATKWVDGVGKLLPAIAQYFGL